MQKLSTSILLAMIIATIAAAQVAPSRETPPGKQTTRDELTAEEARDFLLGSDDADCDAIKNRSDNCPITYNPDQSDRDKDRIGDACDAGSSSTYRADIRCWYRDEEAPNAIFWKELQKLCGKAYAGTVAAAPADDTTFKDKALIMHVRSCEMNRIRIPFVVGTDRSRTWVLTRGGNRIELRHDHRHADGKPDKVTMYGGWTTSVGMPSRQMFPADEQTVNFIAAAATNVWWIDLVPGESFSYNLRRVGTDRYFSIKFDLKTPVKTPEAPWGWKD